MIVAFINMFVFSLVMSASPGPVNMISLSIGVNCGLKRALPFVLGATFGFTLLLLIIGLTMEFGVGELGSQSSRFRSVLSVGGAVFMIYLGCRMFNSGSVTRATLKDVPSFYDGVVVQWLNPKAWAASMAGVGAFNIGHSTAKLLQFVSIYFVVCFVAIGCWAACGEKLQSVLGRNSRLQMFNMIMGSGLIVLSLILLAQYNQGVS